MNFLSLNLFKVSFWKYFISILCLKSFMLFNIISFAKLSAFGESERNFRSDNYLRGDSHEIVFPRITTTVDRVRRDYSSSSMSERVLTIKAANLNTTFYIVIYPNNEFKSTKLIEDRDLVNDELIRDRSDNCLFTGLLISPFKGRAAVTLCDDSNKMNALVITESHGAFVLRPFDSQYYQQIKSNKKKSRKGINSRQKQTESAFVDNEESDPKLSFPINTNDSEDSPQLAAHVLVKVDPTQTEFCDLAFIDESDRKKAFNQFIATNDDEIDSQSNTMNEIFQKRKRRAVTNRKTIETAIFIDKHLLNRFNGQRSDLTRLVLSIMNEVQLIYSFKSMKTRIKIVIAKMVFLSQPDSEPDNADGDIDQYLDNFCGWQAKKWRSEETNKRWDHALMLTGLDLFKQNGDKKNKKVLGLAWVNGMCKPTYSCTLNEGKSFEAAFVIAHEMGHSLGILHDGTGNNCDPDKYIMSEKTGPGKINWSPCSNIYLENFLTKANAKCLDDESNPSGPELDFDRSHRLPGEQYPPNKQCQLALGSQYKAYTSSKEPFNDICRELWCLSGSWATPAHPALEGSACADGKKCVQGSCQSSASYVSRRSIKTVPKAANDLHYNDFSSKKSNRTKKASKGMSRDLMDSIKGFLRSATSGAQDFFKFFTG